MLFADLAAIGPFIVEIDAEAVSAPFRHNRSMMALSMAAALAALLAALELSERARAHAARGASLWLLPCGAMLGAGVWASHHIGLLAFESPLTRGWDASNAMISAAVAATAGMLAALITGPRRVWWRAAPAGLLFSLGMAGMHYFGMLGLQLDAVLTYRPLPALGAMLGSIVVCVIGFGLAFGLSGLLSRLLATLVLSAAVASLHYVEMAAVVVRPQPSFLPPQALELTPGNAAWSIAIGMVSLSVLALLATTLDRRRRPLQAFAIKPAETAVLVEASDPAALVVLPSRPASENGEGVVVLPRRGTTNDR